MAILMTGIDHNLADLDMRSRFSFTRKMAEDAFAWLMERYPLDGCAILSTCNRMELWVSAEDASLSPLTMLCGF